ncbi:MAG TPA: VC0807 family protein [Phototrophicaceae bacterium]|nr:VC0807 family protein [Phototrophicaceae bacterium]
MSQNDQLRPQVKSVPKRLFLSLAVGGLLPLILYTLLRPLVATDTIALAIAGGVSVLWTLFQWLLRRRIDWISGLSVLGFGIAIGLSILTGGSSLALELREAVVASILGLALLISVLLGQPLLTLIPKLLTQRDPALASRIEARSSNPATRKRLTFSTVVLGLALFAKAAIDLVLALTLSTPDFLTTSKMINWAIIGGIVVFMWWMRSRAGNISGHTS